MTVASDLTDIYYPTSSPSSTRRNSKKPSTINPYLYASIGAIVVIVLFLVLASTVLIGMYIWFKRAIVSDASCMEAAAPSKSSAPWSVYIVNVLRYYILTCVCISVL